jgi:methylmalonyl-CoA mutase cobalamin-binding subunit
MPSEEIAAAARKKRAKAVALSIVYPADDPQVGKELAKLGNLMGGKVLLLVGGASSPAYSEILKEIGAVITTDIPSLRSELQKVRTEANTD